VIAAAVLWAVAAAPAGGSFEDVAGRATPVTDLAMLVAPFVDDCSSRRREPERGRCLGMRSFLRRDLPGRAFVATRPGAEVLGISEFDPAAKGFHLALAGCLACAQPLQVGTERRLLSLKAPVRGAKSLRAGTELSRTTVTFANLGEAERWTRAVRPHLRAEYVFQAADEAWSAGATRGLAFRPLAFRVYDVCTGKVVLSEPPSRELAAREECQAEPAATAASAPPVEGTGEALDPGAINAAVTKAHSSFQACADQHPHPGSATLVFVVAPTGLPQSVSVEGGPAGTALGQCLIDAGTKLRFPEFSGSPRKFKYPLPLGR
jgi:hypothetical protein